MALRDFRSQYQIWDELAYSIVGWSLMVEASRSSASLKQDTQLR